MGSTNKILWIIAIIGLSFSACNKEPEIDDSLMLDGNLIFDPALYDSSTYLVSMAIENPTPAQLNTPVIIAAHGYTATTFEWDEFRSYLDTKGDVLISQVLLGGHGRTYEDFKNSSWKDWQHPILNEINALKAKGYTHINFVGSSTGCPLIIDLYEDGQLKSGDLKNVFLVDPIVVSSNKTLTFVGLLGPMLGYLSTEMTSGEEGHWYHFRPQETLQELMELIDKIRKDLEKGVSIPKDTKIKVYKSTKDPTADAVSALLLYKGISYSNNSKIAVEMIESTLHVVTRLEGREGVSQNDINIQSHIFDDMHKIITQ